MSFTAANIDKDSDIYVRETTGTPDDLKPQEEVCPCCGRCPHCGHVPYYPAQRQYPYPVVPYVPPYFWTVTC